ncbi:4-(cytidine 5'-diphospho)-2-C-methyl-D-erythritol kinase [Gordonibacter massiliensis (ex Traore et al. 2017)]|nr:4-(cytidine 5'-diphospho)-2-C-methyl-D-erythritol kinase [Gordonibacter massiliensis (ex Traore et al. 2017)]
MTQSNEDNRLDSLSGTARPTPPAPAAAGAGDPHAVDMLAAARAAQKVDVAPFSGPDAVKLIAPAKVNLFLGIGERRDDGYHEALSVMHALTMHDVLRMKLLPARPGPAGLNIDLECRLSEGLAPLDVALEDNIVSKAIRLLAQAVGRDVDETMAVHVEKRIPAEAGLGGGSSDAAAALVGAARLWGLRPDDPRIEDTARCLGADVPFFLHGGCAVFDGVGDAFVHEIAPMGSPVVLVKPEGGVSTSAAYRAFDERPVPVSPVDREAALGAKRAQGVPLRNNLVSASESLLPALADVRAWAEECPDVEQALMSGSGSAVFALCDTFEAAGRAAAQARMRGWWAHATTFGRVRAAEVPAS